MSLPQVKQGLKFNGLTDYLQLPSMTFNVIEIDFVMDANQPTNIWRYVLDGRTSSTNYFAFTDTNTVSASGISNVDTFFIGQRAKVRFNQAAVAESVKIFARYAVDGLGSNNAISGSIYSITCYLNGNIVAKYLLNEGTGTVATDTSGNGNNGTINGATWIIKKAPVKGRKNLFDSKAWSGGFWNADGSLTVNSTWRAYPDWVKVKAGTYTVSSSISSLVGGNVYDKNGVTVATINSFPATFTVALDSELHFHIRRLDNAAWDLGSDPSSISLQLEKSSAATAYEPYIPVTDAKPMPQKPKKNMLPPFTDSAWTLHENTRMQVADFSGKVRTSAVENPHTARYTNRASSLIAPGGGFEFTQAAYTPLSVLDGSIANPGTSDLSGNIDQQQFSFDVIQHIIRKFGESVFGNARTLAERVAWVKAGNVAKFVCNWSGFGSGPLGNKATNAMWNTTSNTWVTPYSQHTNGTVTKLTNTNTDMANKIDANGFLHMLAYADASDGVTASTINTDAVNLEVYLTEAAYAPLRQATSLGLNATAAGQQNSVTVPALPSTQYTMTATVSGAVNDNNIDIYSQDVFGTNTYVGSSVKSNTPTITFTTRADCVKLLVKSYNNLATGSLTITNPQLELGSVATSFENYKLISDVKLVPLVPKKNWVKTDPTAWTAVSNTFYYDIPLPSKINYTISSRNGYTIGVDQKDVNGTTLGWSGYTTSLTAVPNASTVSLRVWVTRSDNGAMQQSEIALAQPQVEIGAVATPFESYKLVPDVKHI